MGLAPAGAERRCPSGRGRQGRADGVKRWWGVQEERHGHLEDAGPYMQGRSVGSAEEENHRIKVVPYLELCRGDWAGEKLEVENPFGGLMDPLLRSLMKRAMRLCLPLCPPGSARRHPCNSLRLSPGLLDVHKRQ